MYLLLMELLHKISDIFGLSMIMWMLNSPQIYSVKQDTCSAMFGDMQFKIVSMEISPLNMEEEGRMHNLIMAIVGGLPVRINKPSIHNLA